MRFILSTTLALLASIVHAQDWHPKIFPHLSEAECKAKGGYFGVLGIPGNSHPPECNLPTSDKGTACTSSAQCEGYCVAVGRPREGEAARGQCSDRQKLFSCRTYVEGGIARYVCVD